ncbi:FAD/FMN-containing dehydrogenase [Marinobacter phage PS6]|nr:FAD/FMN-containing dehydrogenase [Marinobacter phage PS6]
MSEVELYTVNYDFNRWHYTSADEDVYVSPLTFRAVPIDRGNVEISTDDTTASFTVNCALDLEFLELFRVSPPSGLVTLKCERYDLESETVVEVIFKGRIINVGIAEGEGQVNVSCESSSQAIRRMGLRRHYQYGCPHMLYGADCGVDRGQFVTVGPASNITGGTIDMTAVAGKDDGYYAGGYIEYTHSTLNTTERIAVSDSTGITLTLFSFPVGLSAGDEVRAYAGCDRVLATCDQKFNNAENYGGMPFIPTKNPFGNDPLF